MQKNKESKNQNKRCHFICKALVLVATAGTMLCSNLSAQQENDKKQLANRVGGPATAATLITNIPGRQSTSLDGQWSYIVDPYETGFYDYRYKELAEQNPGAYWASTDHRSKSDLVEFGYNNDKYSLQVPGDWNHQDRLFTYYEGTVWYHRTFSYTRKQSGSKVYLYFGAANYRSDVYLNGKKLGSHEGGFTPFNFQVPDTLLKTTGNDLVVRVNNNRHVDDVPTRNTDWWNYGGITRSVELLELPQLFIQDYMIQLKKPEPGQAPATRNTEVEGWIELNNIPKQSAEITIKIPELKVNQVIRTTGKKVPISFKLPTVQLWSPQHPKLYQVSVELNKHAVKEKIGFRTIEAYGKQVLLNGKPIFMRGIAIHEEIPEQERRAYSREDALQLLLQSKALGCNMVRLAHYPHDESMTRAADSMGMLVWSEIPVYWTIDFKSKDVYNKAAAQLDEMITRDHNRASVIIWSVGNETPVSPARTDFMHKLITRAHSLDNTRMVSAALEVNYNSGKSVNEIDDPLGAFVDLVSFNEYLGWYGGMPDKCRMANWATIYQKPLFISETGAGAKYGFHADTATRFSEEYQAWYYREQINMLRRMPDNWVGITPWVLADFRSPKRNNPIYQQGWNRKGLYDNKGKKKMAFYLLRDFYKEIKEKGIQATKNK